MMVKKRLVSFALAAAMVLPAVGVTEIGSSGVFESMSISASAASDFSSEKVSVKSSYSATENSVTISWEKVSGATGYRIYRYDKTKGKYVKIKTIKDSTVLSYTDSKLKSAVRYSYKVKAYKKSNGKNTWTKASDVKYTATKPKKAPEITSVSDSGTKVTVEWKKVTGSGYQLYMSLGTENEYVKIATINKASTTSYTVDLSDYYYEYYMLNGVKFKIRAFKTDEAGGMVKTKCDVSDNCYPISVIKECFSDGISIFKTAEKGSRNLTYKIYNTQGESTTKTTGYISDTDKAILKAFAKEHFKSSWSSATKIAYTLNWINKNVDYAYDYTKVSGLTVAQAVFEKKMGQCYQYNGALVEMINYLGYEASLVQGYYNNVGNQHFWAEMKINGKKYVLETGNYGKNGDWMYMCIRYKYSDYVRVSYGD